MTDSAIAARIVNALEAAADREAGAQTALVSVTLDMLARADAGSIEPTSAQTRTRSCPPNSAPFGDRIVAASSVHKVIPAPSGASNRG
jgi:hypothetical protein